MERRGLSRDRMWMARWSAGWAGLLSCATFLGCGEAPDLPQSSERPAPIAQSDLAVTVEDGYVTVRAHDTSVEAILEEIAHKSGLTIASHEPLEERVTLDFERLPLSEALSRVLRDASFVLSVAHAPSPAPSSRAVPQKLWLLSGDASGVFTGSSLGDEAKANDGISLSADEINQSVSLALSDSNANVRADAVSALGSARNDTDAAALAHAALSDANPAVREEAAYALGEIGGEMSLHALGQALRDPQRDVKRAAIEALASIGGDQAASTMAAVLDDPDPTLRAAAVDALGEIAGDTAIRLLQKATADTESYVGDSAAERLVALRAGPRPH